MVNETHTIELSAVLEGAAQKYPEYEAEITKVIKELGQASYPIQYELLGLVLTNPVLSTSLVQESPKEKHFDVQSRLKILLEGVWAILAFSLISPTSQEETIKLLKEAANKVGATTNVLVQGEETSRKNNNNEDETVLQITMVVDGKKYKLETGVSGYDVFANLTTLNEQFGEWVFAKELRPNLDTSPFIYNPDFLITEKEIQQDAHNISNKHGVNAFMTYANNLFKKASVPLIIETLEHGKTAICYRLTRDPKATQQVVESDAYSAEVDEPVGNLVS